MTEEKEKEYACPNCDTDKPGYRDPCPECGYDDKESPSPNKK